MGIASLLVLGLVPQLIAARSLQARLSVSCDYATAASSGDTCSSFAGAWGLTDGDFAALNPGVSCPGALVAGQDYCVIGTVTTGAPTTTAKPTTTTKATTTSKPTTSTQTTSTSSSMPTQSGLAANCKTFHMVASGDTCDAIEKQYGISQASFSSWNPSIDSSCGNLWLGYYVCVGVTGTPTATTTKAPTTTAVPTGPSPQMPSIVSSCNKFYQVQSGDACAALEQKNGISSAQFQSWNPYVDANCDNLWLGYYVCVGASGTTTTPPKTTTTTAAPAGPTPQMPNTVSNCKKFYQVQSGDGCWAIEQAKGISAAQFQSWNPYIDASCSNLWLGYYVCIGV